MRSDDVKSWMLRDLIICRLWSCVLLSEQSIFRPGQPDNRAS